MSTASLTKSLLLTSSCVVLVALIATASAVSARTHSGDVAWARIMNQDGATIGGAVLTQRGQEVRLHAWARGLAPGKHGIHFHAVGSCDGGAAFTSAGSHFNPDTHKHHGLLNAQGPHAGDLPNLVARPSGLGLLRATTNRVSLTDGPKTLFDSDGSALIIHAGEDDQVTDPTGNSGARIACGVIQRAG